MAWTLVVFEPSVHLCHVSARSVKIGAKNSTLGVYLNTVLIRTQAIFDKCT